MKNGDVQTVLGIKIEAVPAYNLVHKRDSGGGISRASATATS